MEPARDVFIRKVGAILEELFPESPVNPPGFVLAEYLWACLGAWESSTRAVRAWYASHSIRFWTDPPGSGVLPKDPL